MTETGWEWRQGERPPVAKDHTRAKHELLRKYVHRYLRITAGRAARMGADMYKCTFIDAFAGGGEFSIEEDDTERVAGTPLAMIEAATEAIAEVHEEVPHNRRGRPMETDIRFWFNDKDPETAEYLKEVLRNAGHEVDDRRIRVTSARFSEKLDEMIGFVKDQQPKAGKAIFLADQTGYSAVLPDHIRTILGSLHKPEVILIMAAGMMFNRGRGQNQEKWHEHLGRKEWLKPDVVAQLRAWDENEKTRAVVLRMILDEMAAKTRPDGYSCFTLSPHPGRNAMWIMHLVRGPGAIRARDAFVETQWETEGAMLHVAGSPENYLGYRGLRTMDTPDMLMRFHLVDHERAALMDEYGKKMIGEILSGRGWAPGGVVVGELLRQTANTTALTHDDRLRALTAAWRQRGKDLECRDIKGQRIVSRTNRILRANDLLRIGNQFTFLF